MNSNFRYLSGSINRDICFSLKQCYYGEKKSTSNKFCVVCLNLTPLPPIWLGLMEIVMIMHLIPADLFEALYRDWFENTRLPLGSIVSVVAGQLHVHLFLLLAGEHLLAHITCCHHKGRGMGIIFFEEDTFVTVYDAILLFFLSCFSSQPLTSSFIFFPGP